MGLPRTSANSLGVMSCLFRNVVAVSSRTCILQMTTCRVDVPNVVEMPYSSLQRSLLVRICFPFNSAILRSLEKDQSSATGARRNNNKRGKKKESLFAETLERTNQRLRTCANQWARSMSQAPRDIIFPVHQCQKKKTFCNHIRR